MNASLTPGLVILGALLLIFGWFESLHPGFVRDLWDDLRGIFRD